MTAQVPRDLEIAPVEAYTPAERAFERRRRTLGLFLAPALFIIVLALPTNLEPQAHKMAATMTLVVVLWMTEAIPLAVTALIGPGVAVALQIAPVRQAYAPFADPIIFLVLGGFVIARAMLVHGVDRRVVYRALSIPGLGSSALRVLIVYGALCVAISMWVSNTATTAMMFPIGLSVVAHMRQSEQAHTGRGLSLRDGDDAADGVRGLDWRDGDPGRHGHESDRHRDARSDGRGPRHVRRLDHPGDADGRDPVRGAHPALSVRGRSGPDVGGQCRVRARTNWRAWDRRRGRSGTCLPCSR